MAPKKQGSTGRGSRIGAADTAIAFGGQSDRSCGETWRGRGPVIWLQGGGDPGCTAELLQSIDQSRAEAFIDFRMDVDFYPTFMAPASDRALFSVSNALAGRAPLDLLVIEGGGPPDGLCSIGETPGRLVPFATWVRDLASASRQVVAVGTCAARLASRLVDKAKLMIIPGCPAPPERVFAMLARALPVLVRTIRDRRRPSSLRTPAAAPQAIRAG